MSIPLTVTDTTSFIIPGSQRASTSMCPCGIMWCAINMNAVPNFLTTMGRRTANRLISATYNTSAGRQSSCGRGAVRPN